MLLRRIAVLAVMAIFPIIAALTLVDTPRAVSATDPGTIAYVRRSSGEIRLVQPDGTNDRHLWTSSATDMLLGIVNLAWRPDGKALAFSSDQEHSCSVYDSDVYTILNNGTGLRRVTNSPTCAELANYPKGTVTVTVYNYFSLAWVYVTGSTQLVSLTFGAWDVTFTDVADLGPGVQQGVAGIYGMYRTPPGGVDVQAGQTVQALPITISDGTVFADYGTGELGWRSDGSQIGYAMRNGGGVYKISANPPLSSRGEPLPTAANTIPSLVAWGPASKPDQFLYYAGFGSAEGTEGIYVNSTTASGGGTLLVSPAMLKLQYGTPPYYTDYDATAVHDMKWLPDGSGFLFTMTYVTVNPDNPNAVCMGTCSDVFAFHFTSPTTGTVTQVTRFGSAWSDDDTARTLSISPDGQHLAVERVPEWDAPPGSTTAIWVVGRDGSGLYKLVDDAWSPAWGVTAPAPSELGNKVYLPLLRR